MKKSSFLLVLLMAAGCGKHTQPPANQSEAAPPAAEAATNAEDTTPPPPGEAPPVPVATNESAAQPAAPMSVDQLTLALHHWMGKNQRVPRSFEDFAATSGIQIPPPPAGKKYIINSQYRVALKDL